MNKHDNKNNQISQIKNLESDIKRITNISISLSKEKDRTKLLELILTEAKSLANADGGTLYMKKNDNELNFEIVMTDSLNIHMGGTSGKEMTFPNLKLRDKNGKPNMHQIATYAAITGKSINIPDAYEAQGFDFSGTKDFDSMTGYRSKSFLTVPLSNHEDEVVGVIQLLNAQAPNTNTIIPFNKHSEGIVSALASQAAITLTNKNLVKDLKTLFESFIKVIAGAIDKKSPYTGGHCERVPVITMAIAEAVNKTKKGVYKDIHLDQDELYELHIASWLHDAGKVTIPEYIVDKATKLETIYDRIKNIQCRIEIIKRDTEIIFLKSNKTEDDRIKYTETLKSLDDDFKFIETANKGAEFMTKDHIDRIYQISKRTWFDNGIESPLLTEDEVKNLTITRGTLTEDERDIINSHVSVTIKMLKELPYPKKLNHVPEIAGGHHEKMDGTGYPNGLNKNDMSIQARMLAIADIFEALTAFDRPYKDGKTLSQALNILKMMRDTNHIDSDLFDIFIKEEIYMDYAHKYLKDSQVDHIQKDKYMS